MASNLNAAPLSVKQLSAQAEDYELPPHASLRLLCRTAENLYRQAATYEAQGDLEHAYVLYFRQAKLVLDLVESSDASKQQMHTQLVQLQRQISGTLSKLEKLKSRLDERYASYVQRQAERKAAKSPLQSPSSQTSWFEDAPRPSTALSAVENKDIAAQLVDGELKRRKQQVSRTSSRTEGEEDVYRRRMLETRRQLEGTATKRPSRPAHESSASANRSMNYPAVPQSQYNGIRTPTSETRSYDPPSLPPKEFERRSSTSENKSLASSHSSSDSSRPRPSAYTFKTSAYLEKGTPLRTIFLPTKLRHVFLDIATPNTRSNLETCGILCGALISNALFVSRLVIPDQVGTSDTCETVNEGALFDYCDQEDLLVLGWIHTHPTQTCFMSSRDLHTHAGYQAMLPESIAIVCAPTRTPSWGIFRLTDPPGMTTIMKCTMTGLFHPHPERNVYVDALRPGHVCEIDDIRFDVVDLRPK